MKDINEFLKLGRLGLEHLEELLELSNLYLKNKDYKDYFRTNLLIIDIYNSKERYNDAIDICNSLYEIEPHEEIIEEYKSLLDQFVYIYILKQYYQRALTYCMEKKKFLDTYNKDEVNRWYLELAYINEAVNKKNDALMGLISILHNQPDEETKIYCLSGITKLYVDAKSMQEARVYLKKCLEAAKDANDIEGLVYCDYLQARIYRHDKKYKEAYKIFSNMFKSKIEKDLLNYLNEFVSLLYDMKEYKEGQEVCEKYFTDALNSIDLTSKLKFFKTCLKIEVCLDNKKKKNSKISAISLIESINELEEQIASNKDFIEKEVNEDELILEVKNNESELIHKVTEILSSSNYITKDGNARTFLNSFCKNVMVKNPVNDINLVIFNKGNNTLLSGLFENADNSINSFTYKNSRIYEKVYQFEDIKDSIIEEILNTQETIELDLTKAENEILDYITKKSYLELGYKYILTIPLFNDENLYGVIIYQSISNNILSTHQKLSLQIHSKILESVLLNLFYNESTLLQVGIYESATKELPIGIFYSNIKQKTMYFSNDLKRLLKLRRNKIREDEYLNFIDKSDNEVLVTKQLAIKSSKPYNIFYHLKTNDEVVLVNEQGNKYISPNDEVFYCGTIARVVVSEEVIEEFSNKPKFENALIKHIAKLRKNSFTALIYKCNYLDKLNIREKEENIINNYLALKKLFTEDVYYFDNHFVIIKENQSEELSIKASKKVLETLNVTTYTHINYPSVLVRLDDFIDVIKVILEKSTGYVLFNNDIYAYFISVSTISNCVVSGILDNTIEVLEKEVSLEINFNACKVYPVINGVYNHESLKVIPNDLYMKLDEHMMSLLNKETKTMYYNITSKSLLNLLEKNLISNKCVFIFELNDSSYVNEIISYIKNTNHLLVLNSLDEVNIENLRNHSNVIFGFNGKQDEKTIELFRMFSKKFYIFR